MQISELHKIFLESAGVTTDSRRIAKGQIFFALKGENFDGNLFALQALGDGASYAVVDEDSEAASTSDPRIIPVANTHKTLKELAAYHRENTFVDGKRITVIGLTGTNGKTTTKELIRAVLSAKYKVTATEGNLNNEIGVPLSILAINPETELAVIEMGANHPDDIASLVEVSRPDYGLITNVGKAHLLGFGSFEGVKKAKAQLYDYISAHDGTVFLNADDTVLEQLAEDHGCHNQIRYGIDFCGASIIPSDAEHPYLRIMLPVAGTNPDPVELDTNLVGSYNAANVMAAIAVGTHFGVPMKDILSALKAYVPVNNRSQMVRTEKNTLIVDAYNANPSSMRAALDNFALVQADKKAVLLGSMKELGQDSAAEHIGVLSHLVSLRPELACLVGDEFLDIKNTPEGKSLSENGALWFRTSQELADYIKSNPLEGYCVLVKGSRSLAMEKTINSL